LTTEGSRSCKVVLRYNNQDNGTLDGESMMSKKNSTKLMKVKNSKQAREERWVIFGVLLAVGIGGNWINWYFLHTKGLYNGLLAVFAPGLVLIAIYSMLFPNEFNVQNIRELSFRMWIAIILAWLLCFANLYAFEHGLY
jgi:hypothetical protein